MTRRDECLLSGRLALLELLESTHTHQKQREKSLYPPQPTMNDIDI